MSEKSGAPTPSLIKFFGLTYATTWVLWGLAALAPTGSLRFSLFLPGTFAPAFVAIWLTSRTGGPAGTRALVERVFKWQVPVRWYLFAVLYFATIKLVAAVVHRLGTGVWPEVEQGNWLLFLAAIIASTPFQAGEEIGWRGYALPRLTERFGLGGAALLLGVVWATWHLPLFFIPATDNTGMSFPVYLITVTGSSVALAWLYARTGGSLLLVMLMHAAANNTPHFISQEESSGVLAFDRSLVGLLMVVGLWIGAGWLLVRMKRESTSFRTREVAEPAL